MSDWRACCNRIEVRKLHAKASGHEIVPVIPGCEVAQFFEGPCRSVDLPAGGHEVIDRRVDIERARLETTIGQQMPDGMQRHLSGEGGLLHREIPRRADQGRGRGLGIGGAVQRDVQMPGGPGGGEPRTI